MYDYDYLECPQCNSLDVITLLGGVPSTIDRIACTYLERKCACCGEVDRDISYANGEKSISPNWHAWENKHLKVSPTELGMLAVVARKERDYA